VLRFSQRSAIEYEERLLASCVGRWKERVEEVHGTNSSHHGVQQREVVGTAVRTPLPSGQLQQCDIPKHPEPSKKKEAERNMKRQSTDNFSGDQLILAAQGSGNDGGRGSWARTIAKLQQENKGFGKMDQSGEDKKKSVRNIIESENVGLHAAAAQPLNNLNDRGRLGGGEVKGKLGIVLLKCGPDKCNIKPVQDAKLNSKTLPVKDAIQSREGIRSEKQKIKHTVVEPSDNGDPVYPMDGRGIGDCTLKQNRGSEGSVIINNGYLKNRSNREKTLPLFLLPPSSLSLQRSRSPTNSSTVSIKSQALSPDMGGIICSSTDFLVTFVYNSILIIIIIITEHLILRPKMQANSKAHAFLLPIILALK